MIIGVLQEPAFETRVSLLPETVAAIVKKGILTERQKYIDIAFYLGGCIFAPVTVN